MVHRFVPVLIPLHFLALTGCCGLCSDDTSGGDTPGTGLHTDPGSPPAAAVPLTECKAVTNNVGTWRPSTQVLGRVARAIPSKTCIDPNQIAATLASCATQANSSTVEASVESPGYSACTHTSRALSWNGRHWVSVGAFIGQGASFHGQSFIYEIVDDNPVAAYTGFAGASELCNPEVPNPTNETSPKLKAEWSAMPADVRKFFCE